MKLYLNNGLFYMVDLYDRDRPSKNNLPIVMHIQILTSMSERSCFKIYVNLKFLFNSFTMQAIYVCTYVATS